MICNPSDTRDHIGNQKQNASTNDRKNKKSTGSRRHCAEALKAANPCSDQACQVWFRLIVKILGNNNASCDGSRLWISRECRLTNSGNPKFRETKCPKMAGWMWKSTFQSSAASASACSGISYRHFRRSVSAGAMSRNLHLMMFEYLGLSNNV